MQKLKILTGYELVSKGTTKLESTLPEIGLKDIFPNGSWVEQKQIQAALEARKHLIEVERIEKSGVLSHAVWREELMLAEVTQKVGGYWQYLGHNRGKTLYLQPEEALFLIEINCLYLTHNDVKVSLQQAYALLLRGDISLTEYKVYASLSRLGYRVFRHKVLVTEANTSTKNNNISTSGNITVIIESKESELMNDMDNQPPKEIKKEKDLNYGDEVPMNSESLSTDHQGKHRNFCILKKIDKLKKRQLKPCNNESLHEHFKSVPDMLNKSLVAVKLANNRYFPSGIIPNKSVYFINIMKLRFKSDSPSPPDTNHYSPNDEVNGSHIRRIRNTSYVPNTSNQNQTIGGFPNQSFLNQGFPNENFTQQGFPNQNFSQQGFPNQNFPGQFYYCRQRYNLNNFNINMLFQRPVPPNTLFGGLSVPFELFWRQQKQNRPNVNQNFRNRKRNRESAQEYHLGAIKNFCIRLQNLFRNGNAHQRNVTALHKLIQTYNTRYGTNLRLTADFDLIFQDDIDTISLEDDDEPVSKKNRKDSFYENLNCIKQCALQLKKLEEKGKSTPRHRRAFSKLLKTFNESYKEEFYLTESFELANKRNITLDTSDSSHSDCVVEETPNVHIGKKLKNPFNILKRLSQKQKETQGESSTSEPENLEPVKKAVYSQALSLIFIPNWLPNASDFGRAEVVKKNSAEDFLVDITQEEFLYDFIKIQTHMPNNWLSLKRSYYNTLNEAVPEFQSSVEFRVNSLVKPQHCTDMASVLRKLRIIKTEKSVRKECCIAVNFDVYNRDVQNFKKTCPPVPHFRIVCLCESSSMPAGDEVAALQAKYKDNVAIVYAIVGESISYVQVNATDIPVYISNNT